MSRKFGVIFLILLTGCVSRRNIQPFEQTRAMMDTFVQISIYDQNRTAEELEQITEAAFKRIAEIERITDNYNDSSMISQINRDAWQGPVLLDSVLYQLIVASDSMYQLSDGAFDITIGSVKQLWGFSRESPKIPGDSLLNYHLKWVGAGHVTVRQQTILFDSPEVKIDLGAIAKGYAIDQAVGELQRRGITDAMVNAGGDLRTLCSDLTAGRRRTWVRHPRHLNEFFGFFRLDEGAVATSGDYERYFIDDSVRYHHILDPKTGYPARKCVSVTIQAPSATEADALATAVFVMGPEKGLALVNRMPQVEAIIIFERDGKLEWKVSHGMRSKFKKI